jgi:hypothetical protein
MGVWLSNAGLALMARRMKEIPRELKLAGKPLEEIPSKYLVRIGNKLSERPSGTWLTEKDVEQLKPMLEGRKPNLSESENKKFKLIQQAWDKLTRENGWNREILATLADVSLDTIRRMRKSGFGAKKENIEEVAKVLGVKFEELVDLNQSESQPPINANLKNTVYPEEFKALISEKTRVFVGRKFVFDAIAKFFQDKDRGYFTIIGEPGQGKSTILAKYILDHPQECIVHFNIRAEGKNRVDYFLESVCNQLIKRYNLNSQIPSRAFEDGVFVSRLLEQVSQLLQENEKLTIAIDALDEVDMESQKTGSNLLFLPRYLPQNIYFLLTRRPKKIPLIVETPQEELDIRYYPNQGMNDIKEYIQLFLQDPDYEEDLKRWIAQQKLTSEQFVNKIAEKSEINFMYVKYVLPTIAKKFYKDLQLDGLPQGLEQYYLDHWIRMGMTAQPKPRLKLNIIFTLAELKTPVSSEVLARISRCEEDLVLDVLEDWEEFLKFQDLENIECYGVYHPSFNDFLQEKSTLELSSVSLKQINQRIVEYLDELIDNDDED